MKKYFIVLCAAMVMILCASCSGSDNKKSNGEKTSIIKNDGVLIPDGFELDGKKIEFPAELSDIENLGYEVNSYLGPVNDMSDIKPGESDRMLSMLDNYDSFTIYLKNDSNKAKAIEKCEVYGIIISKANGTENTDRQFILSNGISFGSSFDEVKEIYKNTDAQISENELIYYGNGLAVIYDANKDGIRKISIISEKMAKEQY